MKRQIMTILAVVLLTVIVIPLPAAGQDVTPEPGAADGAPGSPHGILPDAAKAISQPPAVVSTAADSAGEQTAASTTCAWKPIAYGVQLCIDTETNAHAILVDLSDKHVSVETVLSKGSSGECNSVNGTNKDPTSNCLVGNDGYPLEPLDSMFARYKGKGAVAIINADYFGCIGKYPCGGWVAFNGAQGLAVKNGVRLDGNGHNDDDEKKWNGSQQPSLAISASKAPLIGIAGSEAAIDSQKSTTYKNSVGGAPIIVDGGKVVNTDCPGAYPGPYPCSGQAQSAAGITSDGQLVLASAKIGTAGIATFLKDTLHVTKALKFDGGGSAHIGWRDIDGTFKDYKAGGENRPVAESLIIFSSPIPNSATVTDIPSPDTYQCPQSGHVDFEGFPDGTDLTSGTISGLQFMTTGGFTWVVGDWATGSYNGKYPNGGYTSAGTHWGWLGPSQGAGRISFPKGPASYFSLLVSANTSVSLDAYDIDDNKLATAGPASINYATGQMAELKIVRTAPDIDHVIVHDSGNYFLVDEVCTNAAWTPNTIKRIADQTYPMQTGQSVLGSFFTDLFNGFKTFLHIFIGPFGSDVDLKLTRPDGSQVQPGDPDVTIDKTSTYVDVTIQRAEPGEWKYEIVANALEPAGENIRIRVDEQAIEVPNVAPELSAPGGQDAQVVQSSDVLSFSVAASDANDASSTLRFSAANLPDGLSLVDNMDGTAVVAGAVTAAPGTYNAIITVTDPQDAIDTKPVLIVVTPEDARTAYAGALNASTADVGSKAARVTLAATVRDITVVDPASDPNPGDIRNATLTFVDRATGSTLCTAPLTLANPSEPTVAAGTCSWDVEITGDSQSFTIGTVVGGSYVRNAAVDNTIVTVAKPPAGSLIAGGGYLLLGGSAGEKAGDVGTKNDFGFSAKYSPGEQNPQGNFSALIRRTEADRILHTYQVKGDAITSLAMDPARRTAVFHGRADIVDITDPLSPRLIEGSAVVEVNATDRGQLGATDSMAITVWSSAGKLWFASKWDGAQTVEALLGGGNVTVYYQSLLFMPALRRAEP